MTDAPEFTMPEGISETKLDTIEAETVDIEMSAVRLIAAQQITMRESVVMAVQASNSAIKQSAVVALQGEEIQVNESGVSLMSANSAQINNSKAGVIAAREIRTGKISSIVTIAGKIDGNVETILDQRSLVMVGLLAGAAFGAVAGIFSLLKKNR